MTFENNYSSVYKKLSETNPDFFNPSDPLLNCWMYTAALIEILGEKTEREDISDWKNLKERIEEHLIQPFAAIELNINEPDEHWSLIVNIPNTRFCAYFEVDEQLNRSVKIMPISTFSSYIIGTLNGKVNDTFYGTKIENRDFSAFLFFTEEPLNPTSIVKFLN